MKKLGCAAVFLFMLWAPARPGTSAEEWEDMDLVRYCTGDTVEFDESVCRAYFQGILDTHEYFKLQGKHPKSFCLPKDKAERNRREKMVTLWLDDFKERLEEKPIDLAVDFLQAVFPCKNQKGKGE